MICSPVMRTQWAIAWALFIPASGGAQTYGFTQAQALLKSSCAGCHAGTKPSGGFDVAKIATAETFDTETRAWSRVLARVKDGDMPPKQVPALAAAAREQFTGYIEKTLRTAACADGLSPLPARMRRLNRAEYAATVRDLLNIHVNAGQGLPADGAGGEGFDNAAEVLFVSPIHAEKYLDGAKLALEYGFSDPRSRARFAPAHWTPRQVFEAIVPRAFRRLAKAGEVERYVALYEEAAKKGDPHDAALQYGLQALLVSPQFLFRIEEPNPAPGPRYLPDYALASRLSYFLWGSMPDEELMAEAAAGRLNNAVVLREQAARMLKAEKSREFAEAFVEQWLNTRELGRDIKPDAKLFAPYYETETESGIRYEPILFFQEVFARNLPLTEFIDSKNTVLSSRLQRHYGLKLKTAIRQQPVWVELPENSRRGGLLGMAAIHAVSSLPNRTSPVLRGKWVLDAMLGTPPPPPPPNVPELKEHAGEAPKTLRERLEIHRQNPVCASCHQKIDPIGFGLENYDVIGRWRDQDAGKPIDAKGSLPDGATFNGVEELKKVLLEKKDLFVRNLTVKMLGYALSRGLTLEDQCTVDRIVEAVKRDGYRSQTLINEIVLSVPFRYQPGTQAKVAVANP